MESLITQRVGDKDAIIGILEEYCRKDSLKTVQSTNEITINFVMEDGCAFETLKSALDGKFKDAYQLRTY